MPDCTTVRVPEIPAHLAALESRVFSSINAILEPRILEGWGAPGLVPAGLIILETTGRVSGATRRAPVMAARLGDYLVVATFRGRRSQWIKNLAATPRIRYWSGGEARHARAYVFDGQTTPPPRLRWLQSALAPSVALGWAFALLAPRAAAARTPRRAPKGSRRPTTRRAAARPPRKRATAKR